MITNLRTRRTFIKGVGLAAVAAPFLRAPAARAQGASPKRLVIVCTPNGTVMNYGTVNHFFPDSATAPFPRILKPLEELRSKLIVMRGIDMKSAYKAPVPRDHIPDNANMLTARQNHDGRVGGISIDQHVANAIGSKTKFASLQLGVKTGSYAGTICARGPAMGIAPENSPYKAFDRLFSGVTAGDPLGLEKLRADRKSILDVVNAELRALRCDLGTEERPKLDAHTESLRELERSLQFGGAGGVVSCGKGPALPPGVDPAASASFPQVGKMQMDVIAAALACDLTRVVVLQWSSGASGVVHSGWIPGVVSAGHHNIAHDLVPGSNTLELQRENLIKIDTWYAQQFGYLLGKLAAIPEAGGTLLDNSATLWTHEQSHGGTHLRRDMPYVLAGSCGGFFKTGRVLRFNGTAHNNLLISLAQAVDVPTTTFGDPEFSSGPMPELRG